MQNKYSKILTNASRFINQTIGRSSSMAYYHTVRRGDFSVEWEIPQKKMLAKYLTLSTIVPSTYATRKNSALDTSRTVHTTVKYLTSSYYDPKLKDAIDKIQVHCPEHLMIMRMAIGISRNPESNSVKVLYSLAEQLIKLLSNLDKKTLRSIFIVGGNIEESRSVNLLRNIDGWLETLKVYQALPISKLSRLLETVISPIGTICHTFGSPHCLITKAQKRGLDIGHLEDFILILKGHSDKYYIPYIKGTDGPFMHLTSKEYVEGEDLSPKELVTLNNYLENCEDVAMGRRNDFEEIADTPNLRRVKITDPTMRSQILHIGLNVPHYFDVSGTAGAAMQTVMGILDLAKKIHLLATPDDFRKFGMIFAGCNFTKQGYHNFYEVLPTLEWGVEKIYKERGVYKLHPVKLVETTGKLLIDCVDPSSSMLPIIRDANDIIIEHSTMHYETYKKELGIEARKIVEKFAEQDNEEINNKPPLNP